MKKALAVIALVVIGILFIMFMGRDRAGPIKQAARQASVQPIFIHPMLLVSFTDPIKTPEPKIEKRITKSDIEALIKEALAERDVEKYSTYAKEVEIYGHKPYSNTFIILNSLLPDFSKLPERIVVVYKTEKKDVNAYDKKYADDVKTFSELADVSIPTAQKIIGSLSQKGYSISKEEVMEDSKVELLWFDDGWDDKYPQTLNWEVRLEGTKNNRIQGYANGMLMIQPIPEDARVYVKFSVQKMLPAHIPDSDEAKQLKGDKERLNERIKELQEALEKEKAKGEIKPPKRDIRNATRMDVLFGVVKLEKIWAQTGASGIFLGNMRVREGFHGRASHAWNEQAISPKEKAVVLTNAHVANSALSGGLYVSDDLEAMLIVLPGYPFIRFTSQSDTYGSKAHILSVDGKIVMSSDFDCAIMVTTAIPHMEPYRAILGNSDKVREGLSVVSVGNPIGLQKFTSEGVVSRTDYNILQSDIGNYLLPHINNTSRLNGLLNANFWIDTPVGAGGISGSGIWALEGSEAGRVIAINSFGMVSATANRYTFSTGKMVDPKEFYVSGVDPKAYGFIKDTAKDLVDILFKKEGYRDADFAVPMAVFEKDHPGLVKQLHGGMATVPGVHGGIPINKIKLFLQESGLDPNHFEWDGAKGRYWEK
jgi:S1-C subfamily serine protease